MAMTNAERTRRHRQRLAEQKKSVTAVTPITREPVTAVSPPKGLQPLGKTARQILEEIADKDRNNDPGPTASAAKPNTPFPSLKHLDYLIKKYGMSSRHDRCTPYSQWEPLELRQWYAYDHARSSVRFGRPGDIDPTCKHFEATLVDWAAEMYRRHFNLRTRRLYWPLPPEGFCNHDGYGADGEYRPMLSTWTKDPPLPDDASRATMSIPAFYRTLK